MPNYLIKKRTRLTHAQKVDVRQKLKRRADASLIMRKFKIARRTVTKIKLDAINILEKAKSSSVALATKSGRRTHFPQNKAEV